MLQPVWGYGPYDKTKQAEQAAGKNLQNFVIPQPVKRVPHRWEKFILL